MYLLSLFILIYMLSWVIFAAAECSVFVGLAIYQQSAKINLDYRSVLMGYSTPRLVFSLPTSLAIWYITLMP
jgi:uncharacterized protein HemY